MKSNSEKTPKEKLTEKLAELTKKNKIIQLKKVEHFHTQ